MGFGCYPSCILSLFLFADLYNLVVPQSLGRDRGGIVEVGQGVSRRVGINDLFI